MTAFMKATTLMLLTDSVPMDSALTALDLMTSAPSLVTSTDFLAALNGRLVFMTPSSLSYFFLNHFLKKDVSRSSFFLHNRHKNEGLPAVHKRSLRMYIFGGGISKNGFMVTRKAKPYFQGDFATAAAFFCVRHFPI